MTDNDETVYQDLVGFLKSPRADLQEAATNAVFLASNTPDSHSKIIQYGAMEPLTKLISIPGKIGIQALQTLVNITADDEEEAANDEYAGALISRAAEIALAADDDDRIPAAVSLLANITRTERGAVKFLDTVSQKEETSSTILTLLLNRFLTLHYKKSDHYQYVASLLLNITQLERGRRLLVKRQEEKQQPSILESILSQLRSPNSIRRRGVAGAIKNCCFDSDNAYWLLNHVGIATHLLYPLAGPEALETEEKIGMDPELWLKGPDKVREACSATRLLLVDAILLLCASGRQSRNYLRTCRTYVVLKMADNMEEDEEVGDKIEQVVQFLRRDETGEDDGSSDRLVEKEWKKNILLASTLPPLHYYNKEENYDDVD